MSKRELDMIFDKLSEIHADVKRINEEKIPELQVKHAALREEVKGDAKLNAKIYGTIYGGITVVISLAGLAYAVFKN